MPGLRTGGAAPFVKVNGTRVVWGLTMLKTAPDPDNATKFLQLLFSDRGVALQEATGPAPISPPVVSAADAAHLPDVLRQGVTAQ